MKNMNVLNDKNLENVAGGNSWNEYWGEGEPYKAPPRDTAIPEKVATSAGWNDDIPGWEGQWFY